MGTGPEVAQAKSGVAAHTARKQVKPGLRRPGVFLLRVHKGRQSHMMAAAHRGQSSRIVGLAFQGFRRFYRR